jgi:hypothetical protein
MMMRGEMMKRDVRLAGALGALAVTAGLVVGCSSGTDASGEEAAPTDEGDVVMDAGKDPAMIALCEQMVADGLTPEDAAALAEENGYISRVGTIDGEPQAVTMDYRLDRFTFEVADGAVIACTYG